MIISDLSIHNICMSLLVTMVCFGIVMNFIMGFPPSPRFHHSWPKTLLINLENYFIPRVSCVLPFNAMKMNCQLCCPSADDKLVWGQEAASEGATCTPPPPPFLFIFIFMPFVVQPFFRRSLASNCTLLHMTYSS